jgi:hypothetical protein
VKRNLATLEAIASTSARPTTNAATASCVGKTIVWPNVGAVETVSLHASAACQVKARSRHAFRGAMKHPTVRVVTATSTTGVVCQQENSPKVSASTRNARKMNSVARAIAATVVAELPVCLHAQLVRKALCVKNAQASARASKKTSTPEWNVPTRTLAQCVRTPGES